jgi:hypothetical protein
VHVGRTGLFANLVYGQDLEGDDHEGEVRLAALHSMTRALQLGVESRARFKLGSTDAKRRDQPVESFDAFLAPTLSYAVGPVALFTQVGPAAVHTTRMHAGLVAMVGVGGAL